MSLSSNKFVVDLAENISNLQDAFFEHLKDNNGEVLPHLVMADYARKLISSNKDEEWINMFLSQLEDNFSIDEDDEVSNLIAVSFIENLPPPSANSYIINELGNSLQNYYKIYFGLK